MPTIPTTIRAVPQLPEFRWNPQANQYISENGRFVPRSRIRAELSRFTRDISNQMENISRALIDGDIGLGAWQTQMMQLSKEANLAGAALERGGWYQMNQSDFGIVGNKVRGEYDYLQNFANQIADGTQRLDGTLPARARLYGEQSRVMYHEMGGRSATRDGFDEERSNLNPGESCQQCIDEDSKKWVPRGSLVPIGQRTCLSHCNCSMSYRKSNTGETRDV